MSGAVLHAQILAHLREANIRRYEFRALGVGPYQEFSIEFDMVNDSDRDKIEKIDRLIDAMRRRMIEDLGI